jgi:ribonuclease HII
MVIGIDEAGRGAWAGPLVAAAVALPSPIPGITDSKLLPKRRRQALADTMKQSAIYGIGVVDAAEIDAYGLTWAQSASMLRALQAMPLEVETHHIIIDGNINYLSQFANAEAIIDADAFVPAVGAASILAKVYRDQLMTQAALTYPAYGFERHVGYGTKLHAAALSAYGICAIHRRSIKPIRALLA